MKRQKQRETRKYHTEEPWFIQTSRFPEYTKAKKENKQLDNVRGKSVTLLYL